nr:MAG TPA: hypothetical protein [Caudoviricetes sp.]
MYKNKKSTLRIRQQKVSKKGVAEIYIYLYIF